MHRQNQWQAQGDALEFPSFTIAVEVLSPSAAAAGGSETRGTRSCFGCAAGLDSGVLDGAAGLVSSLIGKFFACWIVLC